jgi:hypothetical protein
MTKLLQARWLAEIAKMRNIFPQFEPFLRDGFFGDVIGFTGQLQATSGKLYEIEITAKISQYPVAAPSIVIRPRVGHNWYVNGTLCVQRPWRPNQDTFAQQVLYAADYLSLHG